MGEQINQALVDAGFITNSIMTNHQGTYTGSFKYADIASEPKVFSELKAVFDSVGLNLKSLTFTGPLGDEHGVNANTYSFVATEINNQ